MHSHPSLAASILALAVAIAATACWGTNLGSAHAPPTHLTVTYAVGWGDRRGTCPHGAICTVTHRSDSAPVRVARFTLRCDPPGGTYLEPRAACDAVTDYVSLLRHPPRSFCRCPAELYRARITGILNGNPVDAPIGPCAICGVGGHAGYDAKILLPSV